jgi:hypothetical protein
MGKSNKKNNSLWKSLLFAVIGGVSVFVLQQLFFKNNKDYELRNSIIKENYEYYLAIQNFVDLNYYTQYNFEQISKSPQIEKTYYIDIKTNDTIKTSISDTTYNFEKIKGIKTIKVPTIAVDSSRQQRWNKDKEFIIRNRNKISQTVYLEFLEIVKIVENNPWPREISYESLNENIWSKKEFEEKWFELNMILWHRANQFVEIK